MKKINNILRMVLVMGIFLTSFTIANASEDPEFGIQLIDYNIIENDYSGRGETIIPDGSTMQAGQVFQVDFLLNTVGTREIVIADFLFEYDPNQLELLYYDDDDSSNDNILVEPYDLTEIPMFPSEMAGRPPTPTSKWIRNVQVFQEESYHLLQMYLKDDSGQQSPITESEDKRFSSANFRIKETVLPGTQISFKYNDESNFSYKTTGLNEGAYVKDHVVNLPTITVAGESVEENNALENIKVEGSTGLNTYDYLEFDEDTTNYDLVVPSSVEALSFSHVLKDSTSGTIVSHGKLNAQGNSVSGFNLEVGDNYFKSVVKDTDGNVVKEYDYKVKRLSNDVDYILTGIDNNAETMLFDGDVATVRSNADTVSLLLSLKNDKDASFEFEVSSDEAQVDHETVHILKDKIETPFKIKFWAEDALSQYDDILGINDDRSEYVESNYKLLRASNDHSLSKVEIKDNDKDVTLKTWNDSQDIYELEVSNEVKDIKILIETNHQDAKIMTGSLDRIKLEPGENEVIVQVNAPDGTQKYYTFKIHRVAQKIAALESLSIKVDGEEKNAPITSVNKTTSIELEYSDTYKASIEGIAKSDVGAVLKSGNVNDYALELGKNTFELVVVAEDKETTETYTVNIFVKENSNSNLEDGINPNPELEDDLVDPNNPIEDNSSEDEKDPEDDSISIYRYTVNVLNSKTSFSMDDLSIKIPDNAGLVGGASIDLDVGDNTFTFDVVSQDKTSTSRYIITVNRAKNNVASVDSIQIISDPQGRLTGSLEKGYVYHAPSNVFEYEVQVAVSDGSVIDESTIGQGFKLDEDKMHIVKVTSEDGSTTKEYEIEIKREKSDDALLSSFIVSYGDVIENDIMSSFVNQQYTLHVDSDVDTIEITAKTNHPKAHFTINNTNDTAFELNYGRNDFAIEVRSETNKVVQYSFRVERAKSDNASLLELRVDGKLVNGWNSNTLNYELDKVDEYTDQLDITYVKEDENATVSIVGNDLKYGNNVVEIIVKAQDSITQKTYTIAVERDLSSSADLDEDDISPNNPNHNIEATEDPYRYKVYVPYGTKTYSKDDLNLELLEGATVTYEEKSITLDPKGNNEFKFTITSPNGENTQDYIVEIIMMDSSLPMLDDALINDVSLEKFDPKLTDTVIVLDDLLDEKDTDFKFSVKTSTGINVTYFDPIISVTGKQVIEKKVVITRLSDGLTETYTFRFTRTLTSDDMLSDLGVSEGTLYPSFEENPDGPFEVKVDADVEKIEISPSPSNPNATIKGDVKKDLIPGKNIVIVSVESEDKSSSKDYEVIIYRELKLSELKLGELEIDVSSGNIEGNTTIYTIDETLPPEMVEAYLKAVANHASVSITGQANQDVVLDNTDIKFTLTAQDKETVLHVTVKYQRELSSDARLKALESLNQDLFLVPDFDSDIFEYEVSVDHDFKTLERDKHLRWETIHPNTTVASPEKLELENTNVNQYEITTRAEDGTELIYRLNISRGTYNFLDSLSISENDGHLETSFEPDVLEYEAMVYSGVERFSFVWSHQDGVSVKNANELVNISSDVLPNEFVIEVAGDNGEINEYRVMVNQGVSTRLLSLSTTEGELKFSPDIYEYDVYVASDTETVSLIEIETEDKSAIYSGTYEDVILEKDKTTVTLTVENKGYSSTYTVNFIKINDLTEIKQITANDDHNIWRSNLNDSGQFEITVNHETQIEDLDIKIELKDNSGRYEISKPSINEDDTYEYKVSVTDKYGITKDYELLIKNDLSDNNFLASLLVNGSKLAGFNRYATEYEVHLKADDDFKIEAIAEDENAAVDINIPDPIENGSTVEITVTSEKGNTRVYKIHIEKESKNTALLDSLSLEEASLRPQFNSSVNTYYVTIPYELDEVTVNYETQNEADVELESNGIIQDMKISNLEVGENYIHFKVSTDDGSITVYTIHIQREARANNYLLSLSVKDLEGHNTYPFNQEFNKNKLNYTVEVPFDKNSFVVEGEADEDLRVYGLEDIVLQTFPYTHEVRVVDKQNVARIYAITFVKKASDNPGLSDLWTSVGALSPVFETDKTSYNIDVGYDVKEIEIFAEKTNETELIDGTGLKELKPGRNTFDIIAKSGASQKTYTIFVNRAYGSATLDWLETSEGTLSPKFDKHEYMYTVSVDHTVENLTINAGSNNENIMVEGSGVKNLQDGTNIFEISVSSEYGTGNIYYVVVNKASIPGVENPYEDDLSLAYLDLKHETLNETFDPEVFEYTSDLSQGYYDALEVIAIARNPLARTDYIGHENLGVGTHTITVRVSYKGKHQDTEIHVTVKQQYLASDIHTVDEKYIPTVKENQTVLELKNQMNNPNELLQVFYDGIRLKDDEIVGTGAIIKLVEKEVEYDSKVIVVIGDVNGDGIITIADLMKTQSYILGSELTEVEKHAADVSKDGAVQINDFMMIQSHILQILDIHETAEES